MVTVNVYAPLSFVFAPVENTKSEGEKNRYVLVLHTTATALFGLAVTTNPVYGKARLAPGPVGDKVSFVSARLVRIDVDSVLRTSERRLTPGEGSEVLRLLTAYATVFTNECPHLSSIIMARIAKANKKAQR